MTVKELMDILSAFPLDFDVVLCVDRDARAMGVGDIAIDLLHMQMRTFIPEDEQHTKEYRDVVSVSAIEQ